MIPNCEHSDQIDKIFPALIRAVAKMESARKDSTNPHFNSKYADLTSIMDAAKEPLAAEGMAVIQPITTADGTVCVATVLIHDSGQWIASKLQLTPRDVSPQAAGSAMTYARRYGLGGILGMTAEDDDGNAASGAGSKQAAQAVAKGKIASMKPAPSAPPAQEDPDDLRKLLAQLEVDPNAISDIGTYFKDLITEEMGAEWWAKAKKQSVAGSPPAETVIRRLFWMWKTRNLDK